MSPYIALLHYIDWKRQEEDAIHGSKDSPVAKLELGKICDHLVWIGETSNVGKDM